MLTELEKRIIASIQEDMAVTERPYLNIAQDLGISETELLEKINQLDIGPQGLGGLTTALDVHVQAHPCHIASLPVAVNIDCHSSRHGKVDL